MTVFKGYMLVIRRNMGMMVMYVGIFLGICIMAQGTGPENEISSGFSEEKMKVAVIDRDGGTLAQALKTYMEKEQILVELPPGDTAIQEALFYRNVYYVLTIPEGVEEACRQGNEAVQATKVPDSYSGYYIDEGVNSFLNQVRTCLAGGMDMEKACQTALSLGETKAKVTLLDQNGHGGVREKYNFFFGYMPYALLGCMIMTMSTVIMEFRKKAVRRRMVCSAVPFLKQNMAAVGSFLIVGGILLGICIGLQAVIYSGGIFNDPHRGYYIMNALACTLVAMSLACLTGMVANGPTSLNGINNVVSLGLCFLGGIFVPVEMLGEGIEKVSHFLPTYWYSRINGILGDYGSIQGELLDTLRKGIMIQVLFAVACLAMALMANKAMQQRKE